jgi:hypothetical protein
LLGGYYVFPEKVVSLPAFVDFIQSTPLYLFFCKIFPFVSFLFFTFAVLKQSEQPLSHKPLHELGGV